MVYIFNGNDEKELITVLLLNVIGLCPIDLFLAFVHSNTIHKVGIMHGVCSFFFDSFLEHRQIASSYFRPLIGMLDAEPKRLVSRTS